MSKLDLEARMTIKTLAAKGVSQCEIARMLGVTEGAVRYQVKRMQAGTVDGRTKQEPRATAVAEAIDFLELVHGSIIPFFGIESP